MTRKRFCKKLMALGASRNEANRRASMVRPGQSFEEEYHWAAVAIPLIRFSVSTKKAARAYRRMGQLAQATALSMGEFVEATFPFPSNPHNIAGARPAMTI